MNKNLLIFLYGLAYITANAQSNFEYERSWATYLGPIGSRSYTTVFNGKTLFFDSQNNIYTKGKVYEISGYPLSYYQQYSLAGGQNFQFGPNSYSSSNFYTKLNNNGTLQSFQYHQYQTNVSGSYTKELMYIDQQNNRYYQYSNMPFPATSGVWNTTTSEFALAKYDSSENIIWATYIPSASKITIDDNENVYIAGTTFNGLNIGTPGAYQDNYQTMANNGNNGCGFLVKLNSNGQKIWGTLYPGYSSTIQHHNSSIYLGITSEPSTNQIAIPSSGAFQTTKGNFALMKINSADGSRTWGTYYANPYGSASTRSLEVNDSGIYILGDETYTSANTYPNFYGTPGSHKPQISGGMDLFLTKFNHSGARLWSTYIGGNAWDLAQGSHQPMALSGNDIYICAQVWGVSNNLATPNVHQQIPSQNINTSTNHIFSKFNSDGILQWTSYYGGTSQSSDEGFNIAIKNNSLYLYGDTLCPSNYTTTGSWQPQYIDPYPSISSTKKYMTYLVKFDLKPLSTKEETTRNNIKLHDNPNNGNFTVEGKLFTTTDCIMRIFDLSGKLIFTTALPKTSLQKHNINLETKLEKSTYMLNFSTLNGNLLKNFKMKVE